jgi:spermidine/putrescine transport system permease protein
MKKKTSLVQYPYILWSLIFIIVPIFLIIYFSFTNKSGAFVLDNYTNLFDSRYLQVFKKSIELAAITTLLCLLFGYPVAYILSGLKSNIRNVLMLLLVIPMWMNFLLRTYAWMSIIGKNGIINTLLDAVGLPTIDILYTNTAVVLGMIYNFLPFMIIPIYTVLIKIDKNVIKAAADLGGNKFVIFRTIIFPLSIPGVASGVTMVFMPAVSTFVIPNILGGGQFTLIGNLIERQFTSVGDWNFGSALSILMMIIILISMAVFSKFADKSEKEGGGGLW